MDNNLVLTIEVWESNIEVRILYLSSENAPAWFNRFVCDKESLQRFEYINIHRYEGQATVSQVLDFESKSGLNLPTSYADFIFQYDGANVLTHAFDGFDSDEKVNVTFYRFQEILELMSRSNNFLDCLLIPFGISEKYVLCFDYRNSLVDDPVIVLCKQGMNVGHVVKILAENFEEFINML